MTRLFGQRVRFFRKKAGLSQEKLAELCDLNPTYIGQVERGEKNSSLETIDKLSRGLGVSPAELFDSITELSALGNDALLISEIAQIISDAPQNRKKTILSIAKQIADMK